MQLKTDQDVYNVQFRSSESIILNKCDYFVPSMLRFPLHGCRILSEGETEYKYFSAVLNVMQNFD